MISYFEDSSKNGEIIDYRFTQYFRTKNTQHIYDFLEFIRNRAYPSWGKIARSNDMPLQIILFLRARYTMELFSFLINVKNDYEIKRIINENDIVGKKIKLYIINNTYAKIMEDTKNILKKFCAQNKQLKNNICCSYMNESIIKTYGFEDRIKEYKSAIESLKIEKLLDSIESIKSLEYIEEVTSYDKIKLLELIELIKPIESIKSISINNDVIDILTVIFGESGYTGKIIVNNEKYLIGENLELKHDSSNDDPGSLFVRIEFSNLNTVAEYTESYSGRWGTDVLLIKKLNKWKIKNESSWLGC